ncbi:MAG: HsmA family protein [Actinomycetes bacterium]
MNPLASTFITAALVFYSVGVWGERLVGRLAWWNVVFFVLGLVCDTIGTGMMFDFVGGMTFDVHGVSGLVAIVLMFVHAAWAIAVLVRKDEAAQRNFHRFSIVVWGVWLLPYFSPMFVALAQVG